MNTYLLPPLSTLNLIPFTIEQLGKNPSAPTRRDYELRSRGLAVLGAEVLDIIQKGAAHLAYSRIKEKKSPVEYSELLWDLSSNILFGLELADPWLKKKKTCLEYVFVLLFQF